MLKEFATDDHPAMRAAFDEPAVQVFERSDRMTKSASDAISRQDIQNLMPPDTHFGVHLNSMGAEEDFGPNRNYDSASRAALRAYHPTFEKYGCVYREHRNKSPERQGIGQVKLARYNERMRRGELFIWIEKDKAPDLYKRAKANDEISFSMAMRLPFDRCSCCDKKSRSPRDYCGHLKGASFGRYNNEFRKFAYARNEDDIKFFDISEVEKRADRIATYLGYAFSDDDMRKAASEDDIVIGGAAWADMHGHLETADFLPWENATLAKLAAAEQFVRHADPYTQTVIAGAIPRPLSQDRIRALANGDFRNIAGELAKHAALLDFPAFSSMVTGKPVDELREDQGFRDVEGLKLPFLLSDMNDAGGACCCPDAAEAVTPEPSGCSFSPGQDMIDSLVDQVGDDLGMREAPVQQRAITIVIKQANVTPPAVVREPKKFDPFYSTLAEAYGFYIVKAAHMIKDDDKVQENTLFRTIAAMQIFSGQNCCQL